MIGDSGARETAKDRGAERFQAGVAAHPERRAGGEREKVREEIARHVHQVDHGGAIGHGDVNVHAENQQAARELPQFFDDILIALAGGDDLIDPAGKRMRAGGGYLQAAAFGGADQFAASAAHVGVELVDVRANFRADFDDGLVHLGFDLLAQAGGGGFHQFADVGAKFSRGGINDLEFFFDTDGEPVTHARPFPVRSAGTPRGYHTAVERNCEIQVAFATYAWASRNSTESTSTSS